MSTRTSATTTYIWRNQAFGETLKAVKKIVRKAWLHE